MTAVVRKVLAALGIAAAFAWVAPAGATVTVSVSDGVTTLMCADGALCDVNPTAGVVTFVFALPGWAGSLATGASASPTPVIDLHGFASSSGAGTLTMKVSDVDFTLGAFGAMRTFFGDIGGTQLGPGASVAYSMWVDDGDALFATTDLIGTATKAGIVAFADSFTGNAITTDTFSMTLGVVVTRGLTGFTSFDFQGTAPEPGTLALIGGGLLCLAVLRRRRA